MSEKRIYRVACVQTEPVFGEVEANLASAGHLLDGVEADLVVLPELFATGYSFRTRDEARGLGESFPDGPTVAWLRRLSARTGGIVIGGFVERAGTSLFNSAAVCVDGEPVLAYRKVHLFGFEPDVYDPGDTPFPVVEHDGLRVGVMICFDWIFPEVSRVLALEGADVLAHPSNLVLQWCQQAMRIRALENGVYAVTANRTGRELREPRPELCFTGHSVVVDPMGDVLAEAPGGAPRVLFAEIDVSRSRDKSVPSGNDRMTERRPAFYKALLRADTDRPDA